MLIAVVKSFQVWPAPEEFLDGKVPCDRDVGYVRGIFADDLFEQFLDRRFVNDIQVDVAFRSVIERAEVFEEDVERFNFFGASFDKAKHVVHPDIGVAVSEQGDVRLRMPIYRRATDQVLDIVL